MSKILDELTKDEREAIERIAVALQQEKLEFPKFSNGRLSYGASIVSQDAGSLTRAVDRFLYRRGSFDEIELQSAQVGATVIRMICLLIRKKKKAWLLKKTKTNGKNKA